MTAALVSGSGSDEAPVRVAVFGTGKLAGLLARYAPSSGLKVVTAVTTDSQKAGRDLGELVAEQPNGVAVTDDLNAALEAVDVVLYGGHSGSMHEVLGACSAAGVDVVTSINMFVGTGGDALVADLDARARAGGARILGTGLVPGFRLDYFPAVIATSAPDPVSVYTRHVSNIPPWSARVLRDELGIGELREPFGGALAVYVEEAFWSLVHGVGVPVDEVRRSSEPVLTESATTVGPVEVNAGGVVGFVHSVVGLVDGVERVHVEWASTRGLDGELPEGTDVRVTGADGLESRATLHLPPDGYPGTAVRMVKAVRPLRRLDPGLRRLHELAVR
ncbi:hypothetical protein [Marmoricola sp. RAF53]|uniref:hypothetical protein n=1 Tax=Marmoricola sp. RAF53 TaxID=3233059 RepID=UPI003F9772B3